MVALRLSLLGSFEAALDGEPATGFESNKVRGLLAFLATEADRPHARESLACLLWPERSEKSALRNLSYALSDLRQVLGDRAAQPPFLIIQKGSLQLNLASQHWLDVSSFLQLTKIEENDPNAMQQWKDAVTLYRGDFLEGFFIPDSIAFEEWALLKRE